MHPSHERTENANKFLENLKSVKNGQSVPRHTAPKTFLQTWHKVDIDAFSFCTKIISFAKCFFVQCCSLNPKFLMWTFTMGYFIIAKKNGHCISSKPYAKIQTICNGYAKKEQFNGFSNTALTTWVDIVVRKLWYSKCRSNGHFFGQCFSRDL